jgi:hypothetical protein
MVDAEPPFEQRLRAEGAEQRELHGGGHDPPDTEAAGERSVNLTKQALTKHALYAGPDRQRLHERSHSVNKPIPRLERSVLKALTSIFKKLFDQSRPRAGVLFKH